jgi:hypothetical protein
MLNLNCYAVMVGERLREVAVRRSAIEADGDISEVRLCDPISIFGEKYWNYATVSFYQLFSS